LHLFLFLEFHNK